jgi:DUF4097 and DUF4098 domain-containing protein YvlB
MNLSQSKIIKTGFIIFVWFSFLLSVALADTEDRITRSFDVKPGGWLKIMADRGSIEVNTSGRDRVDVEITREVDTWTDSEAEEILENFEIELSQSGNDVIIEAKFRKKFSSFWDRIRNRLKVRFIVTVPEKYNVDLHTSGGSITVDDLEGEVKSHTSGGSLHFGNIKGPVYGKTSGGSITLEGCIGDAEVRTSGGSLNIGEVDGNVVASTSGGSIRIESAKGTVDASTSGGSIKVNEVMGTINASTSGGSITAHISKQPQSNCKLKTSGGGINVYMADGISVDLDARTSGGRVSTDFPVTVQGELKKNALMAKINGGGPELYLRTSGGNIKLHRL